MVEDPEVDVLEEEHDQADRYARPLDPLVPLAPLRVNGVVGPY